MTSPPRKMTTRREFVRQSAIAGLALGTAVVTGGANPTAANKRKPRVAAVFTEFTYRSHAHVLLENFLEPYLFNGRVTRSPVEVVSFYADQLPQRDMSKTVAKDYGIPLYDSIEAALCLSGKTMAVDAVLLIGEHGNYPVNSLGQREYPRKRFFDDAVRVMRRDKQFVPVFNDKHLSFRWDWAKEMYDVARKLGVPFMAGSSVPLAERRPQLELPAECEIAEAISVHGGPVESYDFHGLELLESMVEARKGGETGIRRVEFLTGDKFWRAASQGRWSRGLAEAALRAELGERFTSLEDLGGKTAHGILLEYHDGLKAAVIKIGRSSTRWDFACRLRGETEVRATSFNTGPWQNRNLFKALAHAIQHHFVHRKTPYPVERTLLTTGVLEVAMKSRHQHKPLEPKYLTVKYQPQDFRAMREMGASWKIITDGTPQPKGVNPGTPKRLLR